MDVRAAGAVIFDERRRLLVIRRGRPPGAGLWSIPGGKAHDDETDEQACLREIEEETGLTVEVDRLLGVVRRPTGSGDEFVISDFLCRTDGGTAQASDDAADLRWCTRTELLELDLVPGLIDALTEWDALPG